MTINRNGAHQAALRRKSVKVFDGAMKVSMMRAVWESGVDPEDEAGAETGGSGAVAMNTSYASERQGREGILAGRRPRNKRSGHAAISSAKVKIIRC
jgi:hypothetical protein